MSPSARFAQVCALSSVLGLALFGCGTFGGGPDLSPPDNAVGTPINGNAAGSGGEANNAAPTASPNDANVNTMTPAPGASSPNDANATGSSMLHFLGRVDPNSPQFTWPGSAVQASFVGTKGVATLRVDAGTNFVGVSLDGGEFQRVTLDGTSKVAFGPVAQGNHTVRISKLDQGYSGSYTLLDLTVDGQVVPSPNNPRRIEYVGASMTVGYGVDGNAPCSNAPDKENALHAFSALSAAKLDADPSIVAVAGFGLLRNNAGSSNPYLLPDLWRRSSAVVPTGDWSFPAALTPQAVVVNVGTNDFANDGRSALDQNAFLGAYVKFTRSLRKAYPDAVIVLTSSPMLTDSTAEKQHSSLLKVINGVKSQLADPKVFVLDFPVMSGMLGCDYHPSRAQQQVMGDALAAELKRDLGW